MTDCMLRLPKTVESNPLGPGLHQYLDTHSHLLWSEGVIKVPSVRMTSELGDLLCRAKSNEQVVRGLENAQRKLVSEAKGLHLADQASGVTRGVRVSRLLILADDGAERFYRQVETLLRNHGGRLMAVRLDVDGMELSRLILGHDKIVRLLMLEHKDAVASMLLAIAGERTEDGEKAETGNRGSVVKPEDRGR